MRYCRELAADLPSRMTSEDRIARRLAMNSILIMPQRTVKVKVNIAQTTLSLMGLDYINKQAKNLHLSLTFEHCMKWGFELVEIVFEATEFVCRALWQRPT